MGNARLPRGCTSLILVLTVLSLLAAEGSSGVSATVYGQRKKPARVTKQPVVDYSRFSHFTLAHKQNCESCHSFPSKNWKIVRTGDASFPDIAEYPEHSKCLECHRTQFFARERPFPRICSNCHIKATPFETSRYPFPSLGDSFLKSARARSFVSDFRVLFPHDKHLDVISQAEQFTPAPRFFRAAFKAVNLREDSDPKSCSVCHQTHQPQGKSDDEFVTKPPGDLGDSFWLKKGTFKNRPLTHAGCFTCHNQESELAPLPQSCNSCHKLSGTEASPDFDSQLAKKIGFDDWWTLTAWRDRFSAGAFRHELHGDLSCTKCHNTTNMNTADTKSLKVSVASCGGAEGCHVTATADDGGVLNYELDQRNKNAQFACVKCHIVFGSKPTPLSHVEAVRRAGAKP
jgi:hypothetical protein